MTSSPRVCRRRLPNGPCGAPKVSEETGVPLRGIAAARAAPGTDASGDLGEAERRLRRRLPEDFPGRRTRGPLTGGSVR